MKNKTFKQLKNLWKEDVAYSRTITTAFYQAWVRVEAYFVPLRRHATNVSLVAFVGVVMVYVFFPNLANADMEMEHIALDDQTISMLVSAMQNQTQDFGQLPVAQNAVARRHYTIPVTAYSSQIEQTDDTPCVTASGLDVCERGIENVVAANFLPIGTRVKIPELFGDKAFYVEDRMNERYAYRMDIWMKEYASAKAFGVKFVTIEVF